MSLSTYITNIKQLITSFFNIFYFYLIIFVFFFVLFCQLIRICSVIQVYTYATFKNGILKDKYGLCRPQWGFFAVKCWLPRKFKRHLETKVVHFFLQPIIIVHIIGPSFHPVMLHQALSSCHVISKWGLWEIYIMIDYLHCPTLFLC